MTAPDYVALAVQVVGEPIDTVGRNSRRTG